MVFAKYQGRTYPVFVEPWTSAGVVFYTEGAEILWIKFRLGVYMPHLPLRDFLDTETVLPGAARNSLFD
jgi:hypothetical protein